MNAFRLLGFASLLFVSPAFSAPATVAPSVGSGASSPKADSFAKWEKEIAAFEVSDRKSSPPKNPILFVGSSTFRKWITLSEDFSGLPVLNRGFGGSNFPDLIHFFDRLVLPYAPKTVVVYEGDNDLAQGHPPAQVLADWQIFANKVRSSFPDTRVIFISIKPSLKREALLPVQNQANAAIRADIGNRENMIFLDIVPAMLDPSGRPAEKLLSSDKLHMSPAGYVLWREKLGPLLRK